VYQAILENLEGELWELVDEMNDIPESIGHDKRYLHLPDRTIEVALDATAPEIRAALQDPNETKKMVKSLHAQGLSEKLKKLKHDVEHDAGKLAARIDNVSTRKDAAFSKGHQFLDGVDTNIGEVEQFVTELEAAIGNGAPE
jgi:hypothetical protein